ncbi:hypothetical protein S40285_10903 [Stachybotrys chlorohalonatus IBT 40285]|uniref:Uncharacterized protein n=1 Tax=Stachybotrys chlorohalonatus (strain IBT 40285) TaxID=1283841 RepID=A0A084QXP2_STAC4|nr:hypothetical protein S40285_10903 [Stachybotrys chlorohalonata IBT 40285]
MLGKILEAIGKKAAVGRAGIIALPGIGL